MEIVEECSKYLGPSLAATSSFWLCQQGFQRIAGIATIHSGRLGLLTKVYGLTSLMASSWLSFKVHDLVRDEVNPKARGSSWFTGASSESSEKELLRRAIVSCALFALFTKGNVLASALPSSIISEGVYANFWRGYVPATGEIATAAQRTQIQILGEKFGCHHCGNKRPTSLFKGFLKPTTFIADHMPPTKVATMRNQRFFRRIFGLKVKQRLYPQCRDCFEMQGNAVRLGVHNPVFHNRLTLPHLVPAAALMLCEVDVVKNVVDDALVNPTMQCLKDLWHFWKSI